MAELAHPSLLAALDAFCADWPGCCVILADDAGRVIHLAGKVQLARERPEPAAVMPIATANRSIGRLNLLTGSAACGPGLESSFRLLAAHVALLAGEHELRHELARQRQYQDAIADSVSDGLLLVDRDGHIRFINSVGARILGINRDWAIGRHVSEIVDFRPVVLDVIASGQGYTDKEFLLKGKSGKMYHFLKTAVPIRDECGELAAVVDTFREIRKVQKIVTAMSGLAARFTFDDIVGPSPAMRECIRMARIAAQSSSTVLLQGESGTGKELFAQAIHNASSFRSGPFVAVNCGAIPRELIESELFGYEEGAFTGAARGGRPGKFELANDGTIFLDEIGDMPLDMQVKLLRVIQERKVMRIGGTHLFNFNGRIIAASNHDLQRKVTEGSFRRDLFYRLNVLTVHIPPLRERKEDVLPTAERVLAKICSRLGRSAPIIGEEVAALFLRYDWPGNVRELENVLERAVNVAPGETITARDLPRHFAELGRRETATPIRTLEEVEKEAIAAALASVERNITRAAELLGISRNTLYNKIKKYQLD
ncbi:sigma-54 interaction domain-containing protein [Sporolituus thermophilus]|uniref:PAS domain S-box-containing protein n=1 Tax=Sporolituus thermophilus DSM 23256 TaxID=1123285 RepID=A0A1G7L7T6_9FIRM|nr:sigma 54-interacting transcriptional regulator [Sporolituus thermophilus]SDF45505.1 PAS domain S-box-containing protein [Sporolituus thermophilus DSM 23256]